MRKRIIIGLLGLLIYYKRDVLNTPIIPPSTIAQPVKHLSGTMNSGNTGTTQPTTGDNKIQSTNTGSVSIESGTKDEQRISTGPYISISYGEVTDYIDNNISDIVSTSDPIEPTNGKRYTDGYGFTSPYFVYVDYEDGHFLHRALLECKKSIDKKISCISLAIFDKQKTRTIFQGNDSQKNNPIIYKHSKDYVWER